MRKDWNGLLKIDEIWITDQSGKITYRDENLYNTFHQTGEQFLLNAAFAGGQDNSYIPNNYYFGLDNRLLLDISDTITTIEESASEPATNGYSRVAVSSSGVFSTTLNGDHYRAIGPVLSFSAIGGSWGPVKHLFMTTKQDNTGILIASVALSETLTLDAGGTVNMRMGLSLKDC